MIRDTNVPINGFLMAQVRLLAEQQGIDCPETLVEGWIREKLDASPEIAELVKMRAEARKQADAEWREKYAQKPELGPEDKLP